MLFIIDPRPYEAEFKRAQAELARARTQQTLAHSERERATKLLDQRAISREEFDARVSGNEQADANVQAAEAARRCRPLNLTFTQVRAPISGLVSRAEITAGNLVTSGETLLTTLVSIDPIYVAFEGDERVFLKYAALARSGERAESRGGESPVWVGLADENGHAARRQDGVRRQRARSADRHDPRPRPARQQRRRFTPGMFARVKLVGSGQYNALLINDSAIGTDQNVRYVFVVGKDNKVEYRAVKLGPVVDGTARRARRTHASANPSS